jgi:hypothetical protein
MGIAWGVCAATIEGKVETTGSIGTQRRDNCTVAQAPKTSAILQDGIAHRITGIACGLTFCGEEWCSGNIMAASARELVGPVWECSEVPGESLAGGRVHAAKGGVERVGCRGEEKDEQHEKKTAWPVPKRLKKL